jgi:flavin reductase (DIM6/NTAB) family NADH-FMN oxidoreductase RutF
MSSAAPTLLSADTLVVHMLSAENLDLALLGATSGVDRFADTSLWARLATGEPYFVNAHAWIRGRVVDRMHIGESTVVAVHALSSNTPNNIEPAQALVYHNRTWHQLSTESRIEV